MWRITSRARRRDNHSRGGIDAIAPEPCLDRSRLDRPCRCSCLRVDLRTYEFVAYQPGTTVYYVRSDVKPGMKDATDIVKAQGLVSGGLGADNSKDLLIRLSLDMLGVPFRHVTGYRSNNTARMALQQNEINFFAESPPGYRSVVEQSLVKTGQVIPTYYDPGWNGEILSVPKQVEGLTVLSFK